MQRLSCFTHSLQLVIKDGLKDTSGLSSTLAKLSRAANLLHSGTSFKDCFEACFGDATIPTANATRWNSTLKQEIREKARYCGPLVRALESSLKTRFAEVFSAVKIPGCEPAEGRGPTKFPFTNAYFIASVLDPAFGFQWLEHDVQLDSDIRDVLKTEIKEYIKAEGDKQAVSTADAAEATGPGEGELSESPPEKQLRMFSHYRRTPSSTEKKPSGQAQLTAYLNLIAEQDSDSVPCLRFWQQNKSKFPTLYQIATQVFSIPASSAPIERVFSHGGILMRPHRARLSSSMLSDLMFLKCNVYA
ncbi:uncharacterized protein LOC130116856 isoform X2 [Lampris incognitus]|uniref:uncharacterized protein LOC130116856 isoform X2 n=1 Tax=Lampris incognitus TaxID=2546036 RepID=UPI0024B52A48|nr:uncharacterized protein LOC130116856 isoform X2 [Lampris incognitus]